MEVTPSDGCEAICSGGPSFSRRLIDGWSVLSGESTEPIACPALLYFHSYRRVSPRDPELRELGVGSANTQVPTIPERPQSVFKIAALRALMGNKGLLKGADPQESSQVMATLQRLHETFADADLDDQVEMVRGNALQILVNGRELRAPLPFDSLSSGQKEIISTLFLIWEYTRDCPSIVLIDEPELHLNRSWHDDFIRELGKLAPQNQYIIATHSGRIAESVHQDRLRLIVP